MAKKILIVEDDLALLDVYQIRFKNDGYQVFRAHDGEEAIIQALHHQPDLMVCDIMMPRLSGFDMLEVIKKQPRLKKMKIIVMSALAEKEDKHRANRFGVDHYLVKSESTLDDIVTATKNLLDKPRHHPHRL